MPTQEDEPNLEKGPWTTVIATTVGGWFAGGPVGAVTGGVTGVVCWALIEKTTWPGHLREIQRFIRNEPKRQIYPPPESN